MRTNIRWNDVRVDGHVVPGPALTEDVLALVEREAMAELDLEFVRLSVIF